MVAPLVIAIVYFVIRVTPVIVTFVRVAANKAAVNSVKINQRAIQNLITTIIKTTAATVPIYASADSLQKNLNDFITTGKKVHDAYLEYDQAKKSYDEAVSVYRKIQSRTRRNRGRVSKSTKAKLAQAKKDMDALKKICDEKSQKVTDEAAKFGKIAKNTWDDFIDLRNKFSSKSKKRGS